MINNSDKIDIILQGKYSEFTNYIINDYFNLPFVNNIILSCWENDIVNYLPNERLKIILNKFPLTPGTDNRNLQIVTSFSGIKLSTTEYSIKMRTDQKYTQQSMLNMYQFFIENKNEDRIFVAGVYPYLLFHPRDHIFWGKTSQLLSLFDIPLEINGFIDKVRISKYELWKYYEHFTRSETYIGTHYCSNYDSRLKIFLLYPNEYLFDNAPKWQESYNISQGLCKKIFKSFPRKDIDLLWPSKNWYSYPYDDQYYSGERWHEDGF